MHLYLYSYNKKSLSFSDFRKQVDLDTIGYITSIHIQEDLSLGTLLLSVVGDQSIKKPQSLSFFGINSLHLVRDSIDSYLDSLENKSLKAISILPLHGGRAVGLTLVEEDLRTEDTNGNPSSSDNSRKSDRKKKNNKGANVSSDSRTKG